jgi:hypothetical protein
VCILLVQTLVRVKGWLVGGAIVLVVGVCFGCWWCVLSDVLLWRLVCFFFVFLRVVRVHRPGG